MIELMFSFGSEIILVKIEGHSVTFGNTVYGATMATIDGLKLSKAGALKEFPDLQGDDEWRKKSIERFKNKINIMHSEEEIAKYVISDLTKFGYKPMFIQKQGMRRVKLK